MSRQPRTASRGPTAGREANDFDLGAVQLVYITPELYVTNTIGLRRLTERAPRPRLSHRQAPRRRRRYSRDRQNTRSEYRMTGKLTAPQRGAHEPGGRFHQFRTELRPSPEPRRGRHRSSSRTIGTCHFRSSPLPPSGGRTSTLTGPVIRPAAPSAMIRLRQTIDDTPY